MRLCCGIMEGQMWDAALQPAPSEAPNARALVVLSNEELPSLPRMPTSGNSPSWKPRLKNGRR